MRTRFYFLVLAVSGTLAHAAPVAVVGEQSISEDQVNEALKSDLYDLELEKYKVQRDWLENRIGDALLDQEAQRQAISRDELVKKEVEKKAQKAEEKALREFYEKNKERFGKDPKTSSYEAAKDRIRDFLEKQNVANRRKEYLEELRKKFPVTIHLKKPDPPRMPVAFSPQDPVRGKPDASITIVEFMDYQCPFCARAEQTLRELMLKYPDRLKVVTRNFPLDFHKEARKAATAALCAHEQGKYGDYANKLLGAESLADEKLVEKAATVGIDKNAFQTCLSSTKYDAQIDKDIRDGQAWGVRGTPAFFVNGYLLSGARPIADFEELIQKAASETH